MASASTWLQNQRKTELVDIAESTGLKDFKSLKKAELESALDEHLRANQSTLAKDSALEPYYKRISASSPSKDVVVLDKEKSKTPGPKSRRVTKVKEDFEAETGESSSTALVARTPKIAKSIVPANVPLPPSPAVVAEQIERQSQRVRSKLNKVYKQSGITDYTDDIRDRVSSSASIETLALIIELFGLRSELLPFKFLTTIPASKTFGTSEIAVKVPDLFEVLTASFWSVLMLWAFSSVIIPLTASYFFNPTLKAKHGLVRNAKNIASAQQYDPLTFNIVKALTVYLVFGKDVSLIGFPSDVTKAKVQGAIPGGFQGILIASGIGALTSLYEAVLRK